MDATGWATVISAIGVAVASLATLVVKLLMDRRKADSTDAVQTRKSDTALRQEARDDRKKDAEQIRADYDVMRALLVEYTKELKGRIVELEDRVGVLEQSEAALKEQLANCVEECRRMREAKQRRN